MNSNKINAIEAKVFRRLVAHLQQRNDVQNIDIMELAGFCRNCLGKWYAEEASHQGEILDIKEAKKIIYGMEYDEWKQRYQK